MNWEHRLTVALGGFDWPGVTAICQEIADQLSQDATPFPETDAKRLLGKLRRKRRFKDMALLGEAFLQSGLRTAQIRRQYAQALIDQGMLTGGESALKELIQDPETNRNERSEARGLLGRIYKQLYVNAKVVSDRSKANLQRSYNEYTAAYSEDPEVRIWQGINMVALQARAKVDGVVLNNAIDYKALARNILGVIANKEADAITGLEAFDIATRLEALIALGQFDEAYKAARVYTDAENTDAFEISSTLRQLQEVWRLDNANPPGSMLLPLLRATQLQKEGGGMDIPLAEVQQDLQKGQALEKVFGLDKTVTLKWYQDGLKRARSICRIELSDGKGFGTGWLVSSADFFPSEPKRPLVLTNAHVISTTFSRAMQPPAVWANFQLLGKRIHIRSIVWSSPVPELDATFVDLDDDLTCDPMSLFPSPMKMAEPGPRMFIIGHPGGRDLEFSLNDNRLIACNPTKLHYRTPTEEGSSGSPIFDPTGWQVVGLHHAGKAQMARLDGPPGSVYEANEGIAILAIREKTSLGS